MTVGGVTEQHPKVNMSMNIFRLAGDMSHLFSIIVLLLRLRVAKNAQGKKLLGHRALKSGGEQCHDVRSIDGIGFGFFVRCK